MREDWVECKFEDLLDYEQPTNYIVDSTDYNENYNIPVLTAGKSFIKGYTNETDGVFDHLPTIIFDDFTTASQFVNFKFKVKSSAMKILVPTSNLVNMKFTYYCMQVNKVRSDTHKRYWISVYSKKKIFLPNAVEQRAIVSKIENLFTSLDKAIADLKKAQEQLRIYRQAVLKKAFEGELTKEWREKQTDLPSAEELLEEIKQERQRYFDQQLEDWRKAVKDWENNGRKGKKQLKPKEPKKLQPLSQSEKNELDKLPELWGWCKLGDVTICLDYLRKPINKEERKNRIGNIPYYGANGQVGWIDNYLFDEELVIVVEDETFTGREIPFSYKISGQTWVNNHAHVLKNESILDIDFLNYSLMYYPFTPLTTGTTGRKKLTQNALNNAPFHICSLEEQKKIVREIESRLSVCDKLEQSITESLVKSEGLRQSILKKAFKGELLSEKEIEKCKKEEDYEPASELLKKIKSSK